MSRRYEVVMRPDPRNAGKPHKVRIPVRPVVPEKPKRVRRKTSPPTEQSDE